MSLWLTIILLVVSIPALVILGGTAIVILAILKGGRSAEDRRREGEEAKTMQEIYQGLERMDKRVEALETILLEREGKDEP